MHPSVGIIVAMASEAVTLFGRSAWGFSKGRKLRTVSIKNGGHHFVTCAGIGVENARVAAERIVSEGAAALASIGLAGGLAPDLHTGHVIIASEVLQLNTAGSTVSWQADTDGAALAHASLRADRMAVDSGAILTANQAILTCRHKESLFKRTRALAVDMESAAVARVAHQACIPFFGLRTVCDTAHMTIPQELFSCLDQNGSIQIATVLRSLARRPALLGDMLQMGRIFSSARKALKHAWRILVKRQLLRTLAEKT